MNRLSAFLIATAGLSSFGLACYSAGPRQDSRLPEARIPEFPMKALASPAATKAGVFISKDGTITRYAVHLGREAMPEWIHAMADEKIGKGEDLTYEAELYPDGSEVYEIYRKVGEKEKQLSIHRDRSLKYLGTQLEERELPDKVRTTVKGVKGFTVEKCIFKEGPSFAEYHLRGMIGGVHHRIRIAPDGNLIAIQRRIPAEFEVSVQE